MGNLTCTASGSVANFYTPYAVPIRSFKVHFSPKQSGTGDPSPSNVRPIEGWTGVTVERCGKNLFDGNLENKNVSSDGTESADSKRLASGFNPIKAGTYTISFDSNFSVALYVFASNQVGTQPSGESSIYWNTSPLTFTITNGKYYRIKFKHNTLSTISPSDLTDIQLEYGEKATPYEPYHCDEIPVSFGELGTIYGGYVDLVTGDVVEEWELLSRLWGDIRSGRINETTGLELGVAPFVNQVMRCVTRSDYGVNTISNIIGQTFWEGTNTSPEHYYIGKSQTTDKLNAQISLPSTLANDTVIQIAARLETPITHTLSSQTLSTLVHDNAFWSNADSVEIEYDLAECGDIKEIRRRILLNTPHLEVASGSVAHFNTDMTAKLKECRVNFLPQQAGSGDPSPSNVRAISGWTGCDVWKSGKNICHVVRYSATSMSSPTNAGNLSNGYGTTISTMNFVLPDTPLVVTQSQSDSTVVIHHFRNGYFTVNPDNLSFDNRQYTISFRISNVTNNPLNANFSNIKIFNPNGSSYSPSVDGDRIIFTGYEHIKNSNRPNMHSIDIRNCGMSFTLSEFMVTPVEDEDYTYAPYDPDKITVSFPCVGKNLATIQGLLDEAERAYTSVTEDNRSCVCVRGSGNTGQALKGQFKENTRYTISLDSKCIKHPDSQSDPTSPFRINFAYTDGTTSIGISVSLSNNPNWDHFSATSSSGKTIDYIWFGNYETRLDTYIDVNTFMVEEGSTATSYAPYTNTIYGGFIDVLRGELVQEWNLLKLTGNESWLMTTSTLSDAPYRPNIKVDDALKVYHAPFCDKLIGTSDYQPHLYNIAMNTAGRLIIGVPEELSTSEAVNEWIQSIGGIDVVYKLATPITYPLTPEIIKTIKGVNNVWSDANGDVSVKYWTH